MPVTHQQIQDVLRASGLSAHPLCIHASLRSFGQVTGGATAVLAACLAEACTVLVPAFSDAFAVPPPPDQRPRRNGWDYAAFAEPSAGLGRCYRPESNEIDREMGAVAAEVLKHPARMRGRHPLNSFAAVGPLAQSLVAGQRPLHVYAPLESLARQNGMVVLMGVGLESATLLHLAEQRAGRVLFRRWANDEKGAAMAVEVGGCSEGFPKLEPLLAPWISYVTVGQSLWRILPAAAALDAAASLIRMNPAVTHCGRLDCERCEDAIAGGPLLDPG